MLVIFHILKIPSSLSPVSFLPSPLERPAYSLCAHVLTSNSVLTLQGFSCCQTSSTPETGPSPGPVSLLLSIQWSLVSLLTFPFLESSLLSKSFPWLLLPLCMDALPDLRLGLPSRPCGILSLWPLKASLPLVSVLGPLISWLQ